MLNPIMHIYIFQIQRILPIIPAKYPCHVSRHEETKCRCEIERWTDRGGESAKGDVAAVAGDDTCRLTDEDHVRTNVSQLNVVEGIAETKEKVT